MKLTGSLCLASCAVSGSAEAMLRILSISVKNESLICFFLYQKNQRAIANNSTRPDAMTVLLNTHGQQAILNSSCCGIGIWDMPLRSPAKGNELLCCGCSDCETPHKMSETKDYRLKRQDGRQKTEERLPGYQKIRVFFSS